MNLSDDAVRQLVDELGFVESIQRAVFSGPRSSNAAHLRVTARPIIIKHEQKLQFTSETATQQFHTNLSATEAKLELVRLATSEYRNIHITTDSQKIEGRITKKGKWLIRQTRLETGKVSAIPTDHNRVRNYLIPEGKPCPFLIETGIMTPEGKVKASHSRKFRQINRFLEFIHDTLDLSDCDRPIHVIDFGCGKSYLTFATHYLLTVILGRRCSIVGLDRRADVVDTCCRITQKLKLSGLSFQVGDIAGYETREPVDLVISLHACDTATDEAIGQAIRWKCKAILAVPCCQHELNEHLTSAAFQPITAFGVTKERFAAMVTDTMRASLMTAAGYQTQVLEFIETEHTPKNLLIRGTRRDKERGEPLSKTSLAEVVNMRILLGIPPLKLERLLTQK